MDSSKPKVLCVDDDSDIRDWMEVMLSSRGFEVVAVGGGRMALQIVEKLQPDLILLDVTMPEMDGYEVCVKLQANKKTQYIPVVFVTSHAEESDKIRGFQAGAADYLVKPLEEKSFARTVDLHLATSKRWGELTSSAARTPAHDAKADHAGAPRWNAKLRPTEFTRFKEYLGGKANLPPEIRSTLARLTAPDLYANPGSYKLTQKQIVESLSQFLSLPLLTQVDPNALRLGILPTPFCRSNNIVPVSRSGGDGNAFLLSNPFNWEVQEAVRSVIGRNDSPTLLLTEPDRIQRLLNPQAGKSPSSMSDLEAKLKEEYVPVESFEESRESNANEESAPIIQLINSLIESAYAQGASDIHIEPSEEDVTVRYRIDGDLVIVNRLKPARLINPMVARLKIMANLDITEHRLPQDGRIVFKKFSTQANDFDLRLATAPMNFGEKVVMRILDKQKSVLPLSDLGFSPRNLEIYREKSQAPYGMVLNVGPTGSGKSMTLYAALNEVKNPSINIQTAEDPIEYTLPGINQLQVHKDIGLDFKRALRSFLRLDPDVILVGEIRDRETADIAIEAALTGHLLLSTLHTNDAPSTVTRFIEMGVEPYLVSSSLLVICAQRLLRRLCKECKEPYTPDAIQRQFVGVTDNSPLTLYRAKGCAACNKTGYKGRIGIHEVLAPDENFRAAVNQKGVTSEDLKRVAVEKMGMTTLFWDAMEKVRQGGCALSDALSNVRQDEFDSRPKWMKEGK